VWVIDVHGDIDLASAPELMDAVESLIPSRPDVVALDLSDVPFIDSSGLRSILVAKKRLETLGARIAILHPHPMPRFLVQRMALDRLIPVVESLEEAVERSAQL
jgi:anti-anti-sigma factor